MKKNESLEQREHRLAKGREYNKRRKIQRQNESPEEKKARFEKEQLRKKSLKKNESLKQREHRLAKIRQYNNLRKLKGRMSLLPAEAKIQ